MKTFAWQRYAKLMAVPLHENLHQRFVSLMPKWYPTKSNNIETETETMLLRRLMRLKTCFALVCPAVLLWNDPRPGRLLVDLPALSYNTIQSVYIQSTDWWWKWRRRRKNCHRYRWQCLCPKPTSCSICSPNTSTISLYLNRSQWRHAVIYCMLHLFHSFHLTWQPGLLGCIARKRRPPYKGASSFRANSEEKPSAGHGRFTNRWTYQQ